MKPVERAGNNTRNKRVRVQIVDAFFALLKEEKFSEISITDLVTVARVSRMSYYRNFDSKEQIIEEYIASLYHAMVGDRAAAPSQSIMGKEMLQAEFSRSLEVARKEKARILSLINAGFSSTFLEMMNVYLEERLGGMPATSTKRFGLYFISGAMFNVLVQWLVGGCVEPSGELAEYCANSLCNGVDFSE